MYILTCQDPHASPPLKTTIRLPAHSRKQRIVETVLELVAAHGTEAVSAQLVADAIGVTQPAVFRHFPTKEAMWLAVMDWLEERLVAIYSTANDDVDEPGLIVLSRMFLGHVKLIADYPALAKLVFSDHLWLQYPSLQARFERIHHAYTARLSAVIERAKSDRARYTISLASKDAATMFLSLLQGLGFQFVIARLPMKLFPEAERIFAIYLQGIAAPAEAGERARGTVEAAKNRLKRPKDAQTSHLTDSQPTASYFPAAKIAANSEIFRCRESAIGWLVISGSRIRRLEIDELVVGSLRSGIR